MDRERYIFEEYIKKQVNKQVNDMLDKIRAEIERKANSGQWSEAVVYGMKKSIVIIDKYKADSYGTVTVVMPIISKDATEIVFHPQPDWGDGYAAWMPLPEPYQSND